MKQLILTICLTFFYSLVFSANTKDGDDQKDSIIVTRKGFKRYEKIVLKNPKIQSLRIINRHGNINLKGWESDSIKVEVFVTVDAQGKEQAEEVFDYITIERALFDKQQRFRTVYEEEFFSNYPFTVDYEIKVPFNLNLDITNELGNTYLTNTNGSIMLKAEYGKMIINSQPDQINKANHQFNLKFIEGTIDSLHQVNMSVTSCSLQLKAIDKTTISSEYSLIGINNCKNNSIKSFTDRLNISICDSLSIKGEQSIVFADHLNTYGFIEMKKGNLNLTCTSSIKGIELANENVNTNLHFPQKLSYYINGEVDEAEFIHPNISNLKIFREGSKTSFTGIIGEEKEPTTSVVTFSKYSNLTFNNY